MYFQVPYDSVFSKCAHVPGWKAEVEVDDFIFWNELSIHSVFWFHDSLVHHNQINDSQWKYNKLVPILKRLMLYWLKMSTLAKAAIALQIGFKCVLCDSKVEWHLTIYGGGGLRKLFLVSDNFCLFIQNFTSSKFQMKSRPKNTV